MTNNISQVSTRDQSLDRFIECLMGFMDLIEGGSEFHR